MIGEEKEQGRQRKAATEQVTKVADLIHARRPGFKAQVAHSLAIVEEAAKIGKIGIAYSGGKDSTVMLDLIRRVVSDAPAAFYDSGCEYPQTYEMIEYYSVETIVPEQSLIEMCKAGGYWGHRDEVIDPDLEFNFGFTLITEPAWRFTEEHDVDVIAIGLRGDESYWRKFTAKKRGELYFHEGNQVYHLCPLMWWTTQDIWSYIASHRLHYNSIYDEMTKAGIPRDEQRVSALLGSTYMTWGRYAFLRRVAPAVFNKLVADFPMIARYT